MTWITPFAAAVPYSADAAGPFRISMLSMSSGFRSSSRDGAWPPVKRPNEFGVSSTRTPSMTSSGEFCSDTLFEPRIRMREPEPVWPALCTTVTPAARPWIRSLNRFTGPSDTWSTWITPTELPISRFVCCWPVAVTTTAPSSMADCDSRKLASAV